MASPAVSSGRWVFTLVLLFLPGACPWGIEGHYAICKMAQGLLSERALKSVKNLLPSYADGELSFLCSWPDQIRRQPRWRWTSPLHYIDTPDFLCNYAFCRDCHDSAVRRNRCVAGAIYNYSSLLSGHVYNLTEALLFLSHFMGDIHQPLHVGFGGDEGGNTIAVRWYRRKTNLHHVWDSMIIQTALNNYHKSDLSNMIQEIETKYLDRTADDIFKWGHCPSNETVCPNIHAAESIRLACHYAYRNATPGSILEGRSIITTLMITAVVVIDWTTMLQMSTSSRAGRWLRGDWPKQRPAWPSHSIPFCPPILVANHFKKVKPRLCTVISERCLIHPMQFESFHLSEMDPS